MSDCNGKCTYCGKTDLPNLSDGKEVNIGYSYAYKVDCVGDRYIRAEEVKYLLNKARADAKADAIKECIDAIAYCVSASECDEALTKLKEQKNETKTYFICNNQIRCSRK